MKIELTEADRDLDVETLYKETSEAIRVLRGVLRQEPPPEAEQMLSLIKRCLSSEEALTQIRLENRKYAHVDEPETDEECQCRRTHWLADEALVGKVEGGIGEQFTTPMWGGPLGTRNPDDYEDTEES